MNKPWKQMREFNCPLCDATYLHDEAYAHELFRCPARRMPVCPCTQRKARVSNEPKSTAVA